jgi:antitoxin component YwqK of YwqJK toxin-antitoxin module
MKILIIFILIVISGCQQEVNINSLNIENGFYIKDGVKYSGRVKRIQYKIDRSFLCVNGKQEGEFLVFNSAGRQLEKKFYKNGYLEGQAIDYNEFNGQIHKKMRYHKGVLEGIQIYYFDSGQIRAKHNYKNGIQEGLEIHYHIDGTKNFSYNYKNGTSSNKHYY